MQLLPDQNRSRLDGDGVPLLWLVGGMALLLVAYLAFDIFQARRRAKRFEALRRRRGD